MNKIEEIIEKYDVHYGTPDSLGYGCFMTSDMISAMKEYAEWYAKRCLEVAAENATGIPIYDYSNPYNVIVLEDRVNIDFDSILNIELPDHE